MRGMLSAMAVAVMLAAPACAQVTGKWAGEPAIVFDLHADDGKLTGTMAAEGSATVQIHDGTVSGSTVSFLTTRDTSQNGEVTLKNEGEVKGDALVLTREVVSPASAAGGKPPPLVLHRLATGAGAAQPGVSFVDVEEGVRLEVVDWGGNGPPLVFLAGLGNTAHVFDAFAPQFTAKHHVYGITRRGYPASSVPPTTDENYDANRLGDDVVAVIDALKLQRPVLAGHSIAGQELSSVGTRYPDKVAGLIYLDAAYAYAFYSPGNTPPNWMMDAAILRRDLRELAEAPPTRARALGREILAITPRLDDGLQTFVDQPAGAPDAPPPPPSRQRLVAQAIMRNPRAYSDLKVPALAIVAIPHACASNCEGIKDVDAAARGQADALEKLVPTAHVVRLPNADHYVFRSNAAEVFSEMDRFMDGLSGTKHVAKK